jgi:hypothetical protein
VSRRRAVPAAQARGAAAPRIKQSPPKAAEGARRTAIALAMAGGSGSAASDAEFEEF